MRQVLQPRAVDTHALLHSLADMQRRTLDQRIRITIDAAPDCPPVTADPVQLESALLNIAINARDAMPEGGTLHFRAAACAALPATAAGDGGVRDGPDAVVAAGFVALSVTDSGTGMPDDVKLMSSSSSELLDADREVPHGWTLLRKPYTRAELAKAMAKVLAGAR